jgi:ADP-heptose:LPS heptosyltransferase
MDNPRKILVIQLKRAGDVIVTTPVLPALRQALPGAEIDFLVDKPFAPLLEYNPFLHRVQVYDRKAPWSTWRKLRAASYDWILDFQSSPRSILAGLFSRAGTRAGYQVSFWGRFFNRSIQRPGAHLSATDGKMNLVRTLLSGVLSAGERRIYLTELERQWAIQQMGEEGRAKGAIGLIPTHRRPSRRWPAPSYAGVAHLLVSSGHPVWFFWGPGEKDYVEAIQRQVPGSRMIPEASLRQMAALLEQCKMVITNDNGPMHLAVAVGTPTVTVYGPTDPTSWNPGGPSHRVVQAPGLSCLGCNLNECPFEHECMTGVTPEAVSALCP